MSLMYQTPFFSNLNLYIGSYLGQVPIGLGVVEGGAERCNDYKQ